MENVITDAEVHRDIVKLAGKIKASNLLFSHIYAVPMGGYPVAVLLSEMLGIPIISVASPGTLIVDDLIDSGKTLSQFPGMMKAVLYVKNEKYREVDFFAEEKNGWIVFPWEKKNDIEDLIIRQLQYIGENASREGLKETPA